MINPSDINLSSLPSVPLADRKSLPVTPAIYFAMQGDSVQYIGKSVNPQQRWVNERHHCYLRLLLAEFEQCREVHIAWLDCPKNQLFTLESMLIKQFDPPLNRKNGLVIGFNRIQNKVWVGWCVPGLRYPIGELFDRERDGVMRACDWLEDHGCAGVGSFGGGVATDLLKPAV